MFEKPPSVPEKPNYYEVLGITKDANEKELRAAYLKLVRLHHPDMGGDEEKFKALQEAYEALTDPRGREGVSSNKPAHKSIDEIKRETQQTADEVHQDMERVAKESREIMDRIFKEVTGKEKE